MILAQKHVWGKKSSYAVLIHSRCHATPNWISHSFVCFQEDTATSHLDRAVHITSTCCWAANQSINQSINHHFTVRL